MLRKYVKVITLVVIFLIIYTANYGSIQALDLNISDQSVILIEAESGQVLFEKNADKKLPPASITKIMTMLLAMEEIEKGALSLDDRIRISEYAESMGGSQIYLAANTEIKLEDLLKAVAIASANDASVAIGEAVAGTYSGFINLMNARAQELGMVNTHFENSTGLPVDNHYSTARDITVMARELVKHEKALEWCSIWLDYVELPGRRAMLANTNKLINKYPGMDGLKTGHTSAAGFCLAATARRDNIRLISVILNADTLAERHSLTTTLLDYGFNRFEKKKIAEKGTIIRNIKVPEGRELYTDGEAASDLNILLERGTESEIDTRIIIKDDLKAPVKKGEILGQQVVIREEEVINGVNITATKDIERANILIRLWRSILGLIGGWIKNIV